jgi:hypothetical protein
MEVALLHHQVLAMPSGWNQPMLMVILILLCAIVKDNVEVTLFILLLQVGILPMKLTLLRIVAVARLVNEEMIIES